MNNIKTALCLVLLSVFTAINIFAQSSYSFSDSLVISRLKTDIYTLSSEEMEGREAGTIGEQRAAAYIKTQMNEIGLKPMFNDSYLQEFEFFSGYIHGEETFLLIGDQRFSFDEDFVALPNSGDAAVIAQAIYVASGLEIPELINDFEDLDDVRGKIFFIEYFPHPENEKQLDFDIKALIKMKISTAIKKGAVGIVFVNTHNIFEDPEIILDADIARESIPIVFAKREIYEFFEQNEMNEKISLSVELLKKSYTAINVAGYIDNNAETTVVIGGHYDHLGFGGPSSRDVKRDVIHFGADDNASGTAGLLEAARYFSNSDNSSYNYIFIAFSAEEKGLVGSRYFAESDVYDMTKVDFMFNFDMIGRIQNNRLILIGTGTSPLWDTIIDSNKPEHFKISKGQSGVGGSDHSSFYKKNIPVIFFHTGTHEDYHASTDTPDKINFYGTLEILKYAYKMIEFTTDLDKLEFTPTPVSESRRRRGDSVSIGFMPDHAYDGKGVRVMAIIENRPAEKAGILQGDIIVGINDVEISEIHSYMRALESLQKGQIIMLLIFRNDEKLMVELQL
jgi:aminopeptidase YwaD